MVDPTADKAEEKLKVTEETLKAAEVEKADIAARTVAEYKESSAFKKDAFEVATLAFMKYWPDFVPSLEKDPLPCPNPSVTLENDPLDHYTLRFKASMMRGGRGSHEQQQ
ncbi:hypothetical protein NE237_019806 [Protea cynaroides]|uniref:Uncharacterized protein n=1 Tax=Protea cynaroides TaxID=273540 RepID=A0A9Q0K1Q4_9MAGN|nr:hypothetical protein NE237_019806 [Protea cynaroides]